MLKCSAQGKIAVYPQHAVLSNTLQIVNIPSRVSTNSPQPILSRNFQDKAISWDNSKKALKILFGNF